MRVFFIGFMASGKTTVGRALAARRGARFCDLDRSIEDAAGASVAELFQREGEPGFRARERAALAAAIADGCDVIATGGGTPCAEGAIDRMRASGAVVALTAPIDDLLARVDDPATRPLLARPLEETRALYERRMPVYRQAHFGVDTADRDVDAVVRQVERGLAALDRVPSEAAADSVCVAVGERAYPIIVAAGALERLGAVASGASRVGLVTDDNVAPHYLAPARDALAAAGLEVCEVVIEAGEASKTLARAGEVAAQLVDGGLDRSSVIVALGGGVVGDLAGFVAATLYRGVPVVQVPTTLLAMIDSAIGGKTGVDLAAGKNLIGAFWQPSAVLADPLTLATLPARERRAAVGELVKYGLLDGPDLMSLAEAAAPKLAAGQVEGDDAVALIRRCAAYKAWVVTRDEREVTGERALLNLGHTIGHAIEAEAGYGALLHGECVALGLIAACRVSARLGLCDPALERRVADLLAAAGLDTALDPWLREPVLNRVRVDKKRAGSAIRFVALAAVGAPRLVSIELEELSGLLRP